MLAPTIVDSNHNAREKGGVEGRDAAARGRRRDKREAASATAGTPARADAMRVWQLTTSVKYACKGRGGGGRRWAAANRETGSGSSLVLLSAV